MEKSLAIGQCYPNLLIELQKAQQQSGFVSGELMLRIADSFGLPVNDVFGVASFYSLLARRSTGRNVIRLCKSLPCYLKSNRVILDAVQSCLGIRPGQTTIDARFSLEFTNCIGLCDKAPAMLVNTDPHVDLDPDKIANLLNSYK